MNLSIFTAPPASSLREWRQGSRTMHSRRQTGRNQCGGKSRIGARAMVDSKITFTDLAPLFVKRRLSRVF
ncbi:hypothetical protein GCM10009557_03620 [Virgisporangium ochraceum]|uniref:Uncharacterized protein n=1 Tax=Virgisporangium ochraceum TaxID=65505 RepID=A0A8J4EFF1_9ACTN|nr:hypothetical protein Voc01_076760 [Virgisporangium ochraceum]